MAVDRPGPHLDEAVRSVYAQDVRDLELIIVLNGWAATRWDPPAPPARVRLRSLEARGTNLAAAMNLALRHATHEHVARMDADDVSLPGRLSAQAAFLSQSPEIVAVGAAFDRIDEAGLRVETCRVPTDPREVRWRLLIENCVAHGSVMLRKSAILDAGGYDESCGRAQDYELWLRLTAGCPCIANLPEVFYRYRVDPVRRTGGGWRPSPEQAAVASVAMLRAWAALPSLPEDRALRDATAEAMLDPLRGAARLERMMTDIGPTRERFGALLWARSHSAAPPTRAVETARIALLHQLGAQLREDNVDRLWLWGAGRHTAWLLAHPGWFHGRIAGIVDDHRSGHMVHGFVVDPPSKLCPGDHVLLSSDTQEATMWASSADARARGVIVWRLYSDAVPLPIGAAA
jgi:hypothetical protein